VNTELKRCHTCGQWPVISKEEHQKTIVRLHDRHGYGWSEIAEQFNGTRFPTLSGGKEWYASTIQKLYKEATK